MATVSLCMIVRNEEDVLARCLDSIADLVDEVIIVDTGSGDGTVEVARQFTANIYHFAWVEDFAAARNFSFAQATMDYCMWLDADDVLLPADRESFAVLKAALQPTTSVVMLRYNTAHDEQGKPTHSYYRERLLLRGAGMVWRGAVHEAVEPLGEVQYSDCAITHSKTRPADPDRNLRIFERLLREGVTLAPREQFYFARELYYHARYDEALAVLRQFLADGHGWRENNIDACCHCAYCLYALGRPDEALQALLVSFAYDCPRAEVCCEVARHFLDRGCNDRAAYWYTIALTCKRDDSRGGFVSPDCYDYLPCIQLCVCYDRMGDRERALRFNELAALAKPGSDAVQHNRQYFATAQ